MTPTKAYDQALARALALGLSPERAMELARSARTRATIELLALPSFSTSNESAVLVQDSSNQHREALASAGSNRWPGMHVWVRDHGESYVVFEVSNSDYTDESLIRLDYTVKGGAISLGDEETTVEAQHSTKFVEKSARERAFVIEENGRVFLTARAGVEQADDKLTGNPGFTYIAGRFVGAEKANSNNAFWSTDDLTFGAPSVTYGPLNWLHDDRQIVGAIADSKLVLPSPVEAAEELAEPYIAAAAVFWRFLYPQQAAVVEQANADEQLWYSMECVSREVACVDHGCPSVDWSTWRARAQSPDMVCEHLRERSGRVGFKDPVFLGGALIVPPVRPGWVDAEARIMERALLVSEKAYDQAGKPQVTADEWEKLVGSVLSFADMGRLNER